MNSFDAQRAEDVFRRTLLESIEARQQLLQAFLPVATEVARVLVRAFRSGHKVLLCGNGGSAADAQHVAAELLGRFARDRAALPAIALTTDTSILTAVGNDLGFDQVFSRQVEALAQEEDVVVGISTSGNSQNVLKAIQVGQAKGAVTVGLTGRQGGALKDLVDICLCVPAETAAATQELHITVWHAICEVVEEELFGDQAGHSAANGTRVR